MKARSNNTDTSNKTDKRESKRNDYPESHVGFPERNDAANPVDDMERVHVDLETLDLSRKSAEELKKEITNDSSEEKK